MNESNRDFLEQAQEQIQPTAARVRRQRSDAKLRVIDILTDHGRLKVTFEFSRPLSQLEMAGLTTMIRQGIVE
jgi:hypothetical protein